MPLPLGTLARDSLTVNGQEVGFRSLSRTEAMKVSTQFPGNPDGAEVFILMCGTDSTEDEVKAFRGGTDVVEAGKLVDGILVLSGLAVLTKDGQAVAKGAALTAVG